jgi:versiconal hemiacetal acetate reductase
MGYGAPEWMGWVLNEEESLPLLEYAYNKGIRTWDTVRRARWEQTREF